MSGYLREKNNGLFPTPNETQNKKVKHLMQIPELNTSTLFPTLNPPTQLPGSSER